MIEYEDGEHAFAVRGADGAWTLRPTGSPDALDVSGNAIAVRAGDGWALSSVRLPVESENCFAVRDAGGSHILWPLPLSGDTGGEEPCTGTHSLCGSCDCADPLEESYDVTISGMPAICTADTFNGTWTVTWQGDCVWYYDLDDYYRVTLSLATRWYVAWRIIGGPSGEFEASDATDCDPTTAIWTPNNCNQPLGCWDLCTGFTSATCVVT